MSKIHEVGYDQYYKILNYPETIVYGEVAHYCGDKFMHNPKYDSLRHKVRNLIRRFLYSIYLKM